MPPRAFTHILCPVDLSDASASVVDHAIAVAGWYTARLTLLNVRPPSSVFVPDLPVPDSVRPAADMQQAQEQMAKCLQMAKAAGIPTDTLIDVGQPDAGILGRAAGGSADLIVMGTHGTSGFDRLVLGSVALTSLNPGWEPLASVLPLALERHSA